MSQRRFSSFRFFLLWLWDFLHREIRWFLVTLVLVVIAFGGNLALQSTTKHPDPSIQAEVELTRSPASVDSKLTTSNFAPSTVTSSTLTASTERELHGSSDSREATYSAPTSIESIPSPTPQSIGGYFSGHLSGNSGRSESASTSESTSSTERAPTSVSETRGETGMPDNIGGSFPQAAPSPIYGSMTPSTFDVPVTPTPGFQAQSTPFPSSKIPRQILTGGGHFSSAALQADVSVGVTASAATQTGSHFIVQLIP